MTAMVASAPPVRRERASLFDQPWPALLPLLALPVLGRSPESVSLILLTSEALFLLMALRNPVWLLGALLVSELSIRSYTLAVGGTEITARLMITGVSLLIALPYLLREGQLGPRAKPLLVIAGAFAALATVANSYASGSSFAITFMRYLLNGYLALILVPILLKSKEDILRIGTVGLVIGACSALAGIGQHMRLDGGEWLTTVPGGVEQWGSRASGLAENPIYLTNDLLFLVFPVLGLLLVRAPTHRGAQWLTAMLIVLATALIFTDTRSWVVSAAPALAVMAFALKGRVGRELILLLVIAGIGFWYASGALHSRYALTPENDGSAAARPVLWSAAFHIALDHPILGVGHNGQFEELSPQYADQIDRGLLEQQNARVVLGRYAPHNDFLYMWVSFGTVGFVLYVIFFCYCGANFWSAAHSLRDPTLRGLAIGGLGAFVAYAVNSSFHNLFDSTLTLWILGGFSIALGNLALAEEDAAR